MSAFLVSFALFAAAFFVGYSYGTRRPGARQPMPETVERVARISCELIACGADPWAVSLWQKDVWLAWANMTEMPDTPPLWVVGRTSSPSAPGDEQR